MAQHSETDFCDRNYADLKDRSILIRRVKHIAKKNEKMKIYLTFDRLFTVVKEYYKIIFKLIFSNLSLQTHKHTNIYMII